ncbi:hypothetical protein [Streptomyces sp. NPDC026092]|uniref:hypothetical protein n=1 Tax=Streptomyces sp. NPDC026092 TaxID=3154797 RepID=UPI0033F18F22
MRQAAPIVVSVKQVALKGRWVGLHQARRGDRQVGGERGPELVGLQVQVDTRRTVGGGVGDRAGRGLDDAAGVLVDQDMVAPP